jgi:hypothetical protein
VSRWASASKSSSILIVVRILLLLSKCQVSTKYVTK